MSNKSNSVIQFIHNSVRSLASGMIKRANQGQLLHRSHAENVQVKMSKGQQVVVQIFVQVLETFLFSGPFRSNIFEPQNHRHQIPRCCKALYANARMPEKNTGCNAPGFLFKISCKTKRRQDWQNRTTLPNNTMGNTAWW